VTGGDPQTWPTGDPGGLYTDRSNDWYWYYVNYYGVNFHSYSWGGAPTRLSFSGSG
jgi:hypothetical protein